MNNIETVTERVDAAVDRASDESYDELAAEKTVSKIQSDISDLGHEIGECKSDNSYLIGELQGLKAGLTMLTGIVEEQGEVIKRYNEAVKTYMKEVN